LFSLAGVFALAFSGVDVGWLFVGVMMAALICGVLVAVFRPTQARRGQWVEDVWGDYDIDADVPFILPPPAPAPRPPLVVRVERPAAAQLARRPSCYIQARAGDWADKQ
jgi:hypothetical protein